LRRAFAGGVNALIRRSCPTIPSSLSFAPLSSHPERVCSAVRGAAAAHRRSDRGRLIVQITSSSLHASDLFSSLDMLHLQVGCAAKFTRAPPTISSCSHESPAVLRPFGARRLSQQSHSFPSPEWVPASIYEAIPQVDCSDMRLAEFFVNSLRSDPLHDT
jgi:hypothetical protein